MTNLLTGQPLTRRERRETEEQQQASSAPAPQAPQLIVPAAPFSTLVMEPEPGPAVAPQGTAPVAQPLTRSGAAPVPDQLSARSDQALSPAPRHSTPAAAQPLSRRERKLLEQPSSGEHGLAHSSPGSVPTSAPVSAPGVAHQPAPPVYAPTAAQSFPAAPAAQAPQKPTVSRGAGEITGPSSLILLHSPSLDLAGPLGDNGEAMVTGQIRISPQVVARGTAPFQYVSKDEDEDDTENVYATGEGDAMVKPFPASQSVASKGNNAELMLIRSTRWGTGAIVTVLSISVFAIAAVTLLALSLTTGVLL